MGWFSLLSRCESSVWRLEVNMAPGCQYLGDMCSTRRCENWGLKYLETSKNDGCSMIFHGFVQWMLIKWNILLYKQLVLFNPQFQTMMDSKKWTCWIQFILVHLIPFISGKPMDGLVLLYQHSSKLWYPSFEAGFMVQNNLWQSEVSWDLMGINGS